MKRVLDFCVGTALLAVVVLFFSAVPASAGVALPITDIKITYTDAGGHQEEWLTPAEIIDFTQGNYGPIISTQWHNSDADPTPETDWYEFVAPVVEVYFNPTYELITFEVEATAYSNNFPAATAIAYSGLPAPSGYSWDTASSTYHSAPFQWYPLEGMQFTQGFGGSGAYWSDGSPPDDLVSLEFHSLSFTIPEPTTLSLLAVGGLALLRKRK